MPLNILLKISVTFYREIDLNLTFGWYGLYIFFSKHYGKMHGKWSK